MGEWARGSAPKELIELSLRYYGDKPLPIDILREKERKKTPHELFCEIESRRELLLKENPGLAYCKKRSIKTIVEEVGRYYGFVYPQMISAQRQAPLVFARHMAFYLCRELPCGTNGGAATLPEIGRRVGNRDHTTVLNGVRKIQAWLDSGNKKVASDLDILRGILKRIFEAEE